MEKKKEKGSTSLLKMQRMKVSFHIRQLKRHIINKITTKDTRQTLLGQDVRNRRREANNTKKGIQFQLKVDFSNLQPLNTIRTSSVRKDKNISTKPVVC